MSVLQKPSKLAACGVIASFLAASNMAFAQQAQGWPSATQTQQSQPQESQNPPMTETPPVPLDGQGNGPEGPGPYAQAPQGPYAPPQQGPYGRPQQGPYAQPPQGPYQQQPGPYTQQQAPYGPGPSQPAYGYGYPNAANPYTPPPPVPAEVTVAPGTYLTARVNQVLSSEHNKQGDAFTATLVQPLVVNGVVVAEPGETIGGQVTGVQESGRVKGTARLSVALTDLSLIDGQHVPLQTQFIARQANTTKGRDAGAIAATTAAGAAIGAAAGWGTGAAIGAGAGLLVSTLGVLVTKGAPSVIYPEQVLTFRITAPVTISTSNAPQAFHWVMPGEYDRPNYDQQPRPRYAYSQPPIMAPYPYYYSPFWYGPSFGFTYYRGGGYYRHWR